MFNNKVFDSSLEFDKNTILIDIVINSIEDIFSRFDYMSLKGKTINKDLEEYIIKSVKNFSLNKKLALVFHISREIGENEYELLRYTIINHFNMKAFETELFLKQQLSQWKINMIIGILFLILCLILVEVFGKFSHVYVLKIVRESLLIIGWIAIWEPLTFILLGWQPIRRDVLYYKKLCKVPIAIEKYYERGFRFISK